MGIGLIQVYKTQSVLYLPLQTPYWYCSVAQPLLITFSLCIYLVVVAVRSLSITFQRDFLI